MFAADFAYHRATSVADALRLLHDHAGAKCLAGGHSLIPLLKLRLATPPTLVDIGRLKELKGIVSDNERLRIGSLTSHAEIASSTDVRQACPALAEAAGMIGDPAVRSRGTIGGNVAHADPASDLPTVLVAAGATIIVASRAGERRIAAADFFQGMMTTALGDDELLTAIEVPVLEPGQTSAYVKFSHPASRYAVVGAAAVITAKDGVCAAAAVAVGGLTPRATRATSVERALADQRLTSEAIAAAASRVTDDLGSDVLGDVFASADYRRALAPVYVRRAIARAVAVAP
jgi:carbon-monoxide dehydrogenase medium subunit